MLNIKHIADMDSFLNVVEHSRGEVMLHLPDDIQCDLKKDNTARQIIRAMRPRQDGLWISLSDPDDVPAFIDYLIGSARERSA